VLDRASTFADPEVIQLLKTRFVPVAIDQAYQRRQKDAEGEFYRKIAGQGPHKNFQRGTTQGLYAASAAGKLLFYNNNRGKDKLLRLLTQAIAAPAHSDVRQIAPGKVDAQYQPKPPQGGLVVRVHARVLDGYEPTDDRWQTIFQTATSRDNLWITASEHQALLRGEFPQSLQRRIAKYHLVDNTRGEPPMWELKEVRQLEISRDKGLVTGAVHLETGNGARGYQASIRGHVEVKAGQVVRLDLVAKGEFWGDGPYTKNGPKGKFPLVITFTLADGTEAADLVPPQGSRGWVNGYFRAN